MCTRATTVPPSRTVPPIHVSSSCAAGAADVEVLPEPAFLDRRLAGTGAQRIQRPDRAERQRKAIECRLRRPYEPQRHPGELGERGVPVAFDEESLDVALAEEPRRDRLARYRRAFDDVPPGNSQPQRLRIERERSAHLRQRTDFALRDQPRLVADKEEAPILGNAALPELGRAPGAAAPATSPARCRWNRCARLPPPPHGPAPSLGGSNVWGKRGMMVRTVGG